MKHISRSAMDGRVGIREAFFFYLLPILEGITQS